MFFLLALLALPTIVHGAAAAKPSKASDSRTKGTFVASYKLIIKETGEEIIGLGTERTGHAESICALHTKALEEALSKTANSTCYVVKPQYLGMPFVHCEDTPLTRAEQFACMQKLSPDQTIQMVPCRTEHDLFRLYFTVNAIKMLLQQAGFTPLKRQNEIIAAQSNHAAKEMGDKKLLDHWKEQLEAELVSFEPINKSPEYQKTVDGIATLASLQPPIPTDGTTLQEFLKKCVFHRPSCEKFVSAAQAVLCGLDNLRTIESVCQAQDKKFKRIVILGTHEQTQAFKNHADNCTNAFQQNMSVAQSPSENPISLAKLTALLSANEKTCKTQG